MTNRMIFFKIVYFVTLDGDVPHFPLYGVFLSLLIRIARVCSNVKEVTTETNFWMLSCQYHKPL